MTALNLGEITATTLRNRGSKWADNITNDNCAMATLREKGHFKKANGGRTLVEPIIYAENSSAKWYDGYETFTITEQTDQLDAAEFDWKQLGGFAVYSGIENIKNSGKHAAMNLVKSRMQVLEKTLQNKAAAGVFADGTGTSGKEFGGLQLLIADDPTASSTIGGINQNTSAWWRNQANDLSGGATDTDATNITSYMNSMWLATKRGRDLTDLILADDFMYTQYETSLQQQQRFNDATKAAAGFEGLKYKTASVVHDSVCPTDHMYFLNTDYLYVQHSPSRDFKAGKAREVQNADYTVVPVFFAGNMTCSNRARQGVIVGKS